MKDLVLIHGRSQQMKDATTLKTNWVDFGLVGIDKLQIDPPGGSQVRSGSSVCWMTNNLEVIRTRVGFREV